MNMEDIKGLIESLKSAGLGAEQINAAVQQAMANGAGSSGASPARGNSMLDSIRSAPDPTNYGTGWSDDNGKFDGEYDVTISRTEERSTEKGTVFSIEMKVDASDNDHVRVGSKREHSFWGWTAASRSDLKGYVQEMSEAAGNEGDFTDEFYLGLWSEDQVGTGLRFRIAVSTAPQKRDKSKVFTKVRIVDTLTDVKPTATTSKPSIDVAAAATAGLSPEVLALLKSAGA